MEGIKVPQKIDKMMDGQIVLTRYNNRTYRVDGVDWEKTPMSSFECKGKSCTFVQYYKSVHNLTITARNQPLLRIVDKRSKDVIFLVPEFCYSTGL